jgi:hypothetical protein
MIKLKLISQGPSPDVPDYLNLEAAQKIGKPLLPDGNLSIYCGIILEQTTDWLKLPCKHAYSREALKSQFKAYNGKVDPKRTKHCPCCKKTNSWKDIILSSLPYKFREIVKMSIRRLINNYIDDLSTPRKIIKTVSKWNDQITINDTFKEGLSIESLDKNALLLAQQITTLILDERANNLKSNSIETFAHEGFNFEGSMLSDDWNTLRDGLPQVIDSDFREKFKTYQDDIHTLLIPFCREKLRILLP